MREAEVAAKEILQLMMRKAEEMEEAARAEQVPHVRTAGLQTASQ
jgi:hypothetical protein